MTKSSSFKRRVKWVEIGPKNGVWQMPLFKFLRTETWKWNFWFDGPKRLKYRVRHFWPMLTVKWYECNVMNVLLWMLCYECKMVKMTWLGIKQNRRIPEFVKERDPTLLEDNVGSLGNNGSSTIAPIVVRRRIDNYYLLSGLVVVWRQNMKEKTLFTVNLREQDTW